MKKSFHNFWGSDLFGFQNDRKDCRLGNLSGLSKEVIKTLFKIILNSL